MSKRWYAVQAYSGYEKIVQKNLLERIQQSELNDQFGDILVPVEEVVEMKACLLYTSPSPRDRTRSRMPSSA